MHSEALLGGEKDAKGLRHKFWKDHKSDWLAMLLGPAVSVPFAACYAALVCQSPTMKPYFPIVLQQIMWTQLAGGVLSLFLGQFVTTTNMDPLVAILFGQMAHRCELLFRTEPQKLFPHMNVLMPLATCLLGAALYAVGRFRLAGMLRFFPYTVIAGFLAGSGLLILSESLNLSAGTDVWTLTVRTFVSGEGLELSAAWAQLLLGCLYAAVAGVSRDLHTFGTPMLLVACVGTSVAVKFGSSGTFPPPDWFLSYPEPVEWWAPFAAYKEGVEVFEPSKVFFPELIVSFVTIMTVSWSINTLAIKKLVPLRRGIRQCDEQAEIQSLGVTNLLLGGLGCHASMQSFKIPMMMKEVKAGDLWPWFNLVMLFWIFLASPRAIIQTVPRFLFAGTVIRLASDLIIEWLVEARHRVAVNEWRILTATAIAIAVNVSAGILFGLFMTLVLFAIEYSGVTGVVKSGSLQTYHSNIERSKEELAILRQHGKTVKILWLSGYLFFGSVCGAVDEARKCMEEEDACTVVLDLSLVPAMDASGVYALMDLIEEMKAFNQQCELVLCGLVRRLDLALRNAAENKGIQALLFHSLDKALEYCEERLFDRLTSSGVMLLSRTNSLPHIDSCGTIANMVQEGGTDFAGLWSQLLRREILELDPDGLCVGVLQTAVEMRELMSGQVLFRRGEPAHEIIILVGGSVEVTQPSDVESGTRNLHLPRHHLNEEKGDIYVFEERRTRRARRGAIFGAVEYVASPGLTSISGGRSDSDIAYLSTGTAVGNVQLFALSFERLRAIEKREQRVALVLRTWLSNLAVDALLAKRLPSTQASGPGEQPFDGLRREIS
mmetsp:Transcript_47888/g.137404  ORF Transcript_47888/g.137404 Transcript_47888/m.137404 type:complete len:831 (+) Transcript_47888:83-2575(+)